MESLYFLIPLSIIVIIVAVLVFFWAVNSGQYDDLDADGEKILFDDEDDFTPPADHDEDVKDRGTSGQGRKDQNDH